MDKQPTSGLLLMFGEVPGYRDAFILTLAMEKWPRNHQLAFLRWSQQPPATTSLKFRHDLGKPWTLEPMSQLRQDAVLEMVCYNCSICFNEFTENSLRLVELRIVRGAVSSV